MCMVIILAAGYFYTYSTVLSKVKNDSIEIVKGALSIATCEETAKIIKDKDENSEDYKKTLNNLLVYKAKKNIKYLYVLTKADKNNSAILIDASDDPDPIGEKYKIDKYMESAFNGQISVTKNPYKEDGIYLISAYVPIKDTSGKVLGILCADYDVSLFNFITNSNINTLFVSLILMIICSLIILLIFSRKLKNNIESIQNKIEEMSKGNLTGIINLNSKDEIQIISEYINSLSNSLCTTIKNISCNISNVMKESSKLSQTSEEVNISIEDISKSMEDISSSTENQSNEMCSIENNITEFDNSIDNINENISDISNNTNQINLLASKSNENLIELQESLKEITKLFKSLLNDTSMLGDKILKISEISVFINEISDQTNLLALNASIEAARAGEAGRGFTIVAEEIRKLAMESKTSANNINSLVTSIEEQSTNLVNTSKDADMLLAEKIAYIKDSTDSFSTIVLKLNEIIPKIQIVSSKSKELLIKSSSIVSSIENAAASSEELSSSSDGISSSINNIVLSSDEVSKAASNLSNSVSKVNIELSKFIIE